VLKRQRERKAQRLEEEAKLAADDITAESEAGSGQGGQDGNGVSAQYSTVADDRQAAGKDPADLPSAEDIKAEVEGVIRPSNGRYAHETSDAAKRRLREELMEISLENEEGYRSFQERMKHEEKMENIWKVSDIPV
jgi:hypothetical protein